LFELLHWICLASLFVMDENGLRFTGCPVLTPYDRTLSAGVLQ
jgi:hypothetical protein